MKKLVISSLGVFALMLPFSFQGNVTGVKASIPEGCNPISKLPTTIDLNDCSETEIRNYYSSLNLLSDDELTGTNLLKNLKPILFNMNYYTYANVWKVYEITDRDWSLSPAKDIQYGSYDASTNTFSDYEYGSTSNRKNDPYVRTLYRNYKVESAKVKNWDSHTTETNREHVWCQSRGFKADNGASGPAGTDVHHLISGDAKVNTAIHNNNPYGYVKTESATIDREDIIGNKVGEAKHKFSQDQATVVFEPRDEYKGDIARACFYMAARYNNLSGIDTITQFEPNLEIVNYATSNGEREISTAESPVGMGILQDLLEWNKLDPVDEFEIHRNNLIFHNFQGNRNPFIDFPEWADYIWGTSTDGVYDSTPLGRANPSTDKIANTPNEPSNPSTSTSTLTSTDTNPTGSSTSSDPISPIGKLDRKVVLGFAIGGVAILFISIVIAIISSKSKKSSKARRRRRK